jgi:hypothetical protein
VGAFVGALVGALDGFPHFPFPMHVGGLTGFMVGLTGFMVNFFVARLRCTSSCDDPVSAGKWLDPRMAASAGFVNAKARSETITTAAFMLFVRCRGQK